MKSWQQNVGFSTNQKIPHLDNRLLDESIGFYCTSKKLIISMLSQRGYPNADKIMVNKNNRTMFIFYNTMTIQSSIQTGSNI
ncbi:hypothetical protein FKN12_13150 [Vibrio sp. 2-2(8)]|nr:hypothetical protein [Vibrio sp. 2-2(8)]